MGGFLNYFTMTRTDNIIVSLLGNDVKEVIRQAGQDLFVEMFVTGLFLEKALDFCKVYNPQSLQISKCSNPLKALISLIKCRKITEIFK